MRTHTEEGHSKRAPKETRATVALAISNWKLAWQRLEDCDLDQVNSETEDKDCEELTAGMWAAFEAVLDTRSESLADVVRKLEFAQHYHELHDDYHDDVGKVLASAIIDLASQPRGSSKDRAAVIRLAREIELDLICR